MVKSVKENLADAGRAVADTASKVGHGIAAGAEKVVDSMSGAAPTEGEDLGVKGIREHMPVKASCGKVIGTVDHMEQGALKLTRKDSPDGLHHFIPMNWIDHVDSHVHLNKNSQETEQNWKSSAADCGCS